MSVFIPPKITAAVRQVLVLQPGELVYDTDDRCLYVGDGNTLGGKKTTENLSAYYTAAQTDQKIKETVNAAIGNAVEAATVLTGTLAEVNA